MPNTLDATVAAALSDARAWPFEEARRLLTRLEKMPGGREKTARGRRPGPIQVHEVRTRLAHEPSESDLARRIANRLRKGRCRDCDRHTSLSAAGDERDDTPVVAVKRDERSGVEGDTVHFTPSLSVAPPSLPARVCRRPTPAPRQ